VHQDVNVHTRAQFGSEGLTAGSLDDLGYGEVGLIGMFTMKEGGGDPHLVSHF